MLGQKQRGTPSLDIPKTIDDIKKLKCSVLFGLIFVLPEDEQSALIALCKSPKLKSYWDSLWQAFIL